MCDRSGRPSTTNRISFAGLFLCLCFLSAGTTNAQQIGRVLESRAENILAQRGEVILRFIRPPEMNLDAVSQFLSIDRVRGDTITAYANETGFYRFIKLQIPYELVTPPSLNLGFRPVSKKVSDWRQTYPSYPVYISVMDSLAAAHPGICRLMEIGESVMGRKLLVMEITDNPENATTKPSVLMTSTIHGDEPLGYVLLLRLIDYILDADSTDLRIQEMLSRLTLYINPLANPDGTYYNSDSTVEGSIRFNANHVDLNRNFPDPDLGDHPDGMDWQPETMAMMNFMKRLPLVLSANFHGGSEVVNYPWDTWSRLHADNDWYIRLARTWADTAQVYGPTGYMTDLMNGITNGYQWYSVHGGRQDYVNYFLHAREVTIECSHTKIPLPDEFKDYWNYNRRSLLDYFETVYTGFRGSVKDSLTGEPVAARVSIDQHDTDHSEVYAASGTGNFYRLTLPGTYPFRFSAPGYIDQTRQAEVGDNQVTVLNIRLSHTTKPIIYPNPFTDRIFIVVYSTTQDLELELTDMSGRIVKTIRQPVTIPGKQEILTGVLAPGAYVAYYKVGNVYGHVLLIHTAK